MFRLLLLAALTGLTMNLPLPDAKIYFPGENIPVAPRHPPPGGWTPTTIERRYYTRSSHRKDGGFQSPGEAYHSYGSPGQRVSYSSYSHHPYHLSYSSHSYGSGGSHHQSHPHTSHSQALSYGSSQSHGLSEGGSQSHRFSGGSVEEQSEQIPHGGYGTGSSSLDGSRYEVNNWHEAGGDDQPHGMVETAQESQHYVSADAHQVDNGERQAAESSYGQHSIASGQVKTPTAADVAAEEHQIIQEIEQLVGLTSSPEANTRNPITQQQEIIREINGLSDPHHTQNANAIEYESGLSHVSHETTIPPVRQVPEVPHKEEVEEPMVKVTSNHGYQGAGHQVIHTHVQESSSYKKSTPDPLELMNLYNNYAHGDVKSGNPKEGGEQPKKELKPEIKQAIDNIMRDWEVLPDQEGKPQAPPRTFKITKHVKVTTTTHNHPVVVQPSQTITKTVQTHTYQPSHHRHVTHHINIVELLEQLRQLESSPHHRNVTWCEEKIKEFLTELNRKEESGIEINQSVQEETLHHILTQDQTITKEVRHEVGHDASGAVEEAPFIKKTVVELGQNEPARPPSYWTEEETKHETHSITGGGTAEEETHSITGGGTADEEPHSITGGATAYEETHSITGGATADEETHSITGGATAEEETHSITGGATADEEPHSITGGATADEETHSITGGATADEETHSITGGATAEEETHSITGGATADEKEHKENEPGEIPYETDEDTHKAKEELEIVTVTPSPHHVKPLEALSHQSHASPHENHINGENEGDMEQHVSEPAGVTKAPIVPEKSGDAEVEEFRGENERHERPLPSGYKPREKSEEENEIENESGHTEEKKEEQQSTDDLSVELPKPEFSKEVKEEEDKSDENLNAPKEEHVIHELDAGEGLEGKTEYVVESEHGGQNGTITETVEHHSEGGEGHSGSGGHTEYVEETVEHTAGDHMHPGGGANTQYVEETVEHTAGDHMHPGGGVNTQYVEETVEHTGGGHIHPGGGVNTQYVVETVEHTGGDHMHSGGGVNTQYVEETVHQSSGGVSLGHSSGGGQTEYVEETVEHNPVGNTEINYDQLIEELISLESLPGHQAIDKCEEKIRQFLEVLRRQQERGFDQNKAELQRLRILLEEIQKQKESQTNNSVNPQSTEAPSSFWKKIGRKIKTTYENAKTKAHDTVNNIMN